MTTIVLNQTELTIEANNFKEVYLQAMLKENIISQEQFDIMIRHSIVVHEKNFFGKLISYFTKDDENKWKIQIVKVI